MSVPLSSIKTGLWSMSSPASCSLNVGVSKLFSLSEEAAARCVVGAHGGCSEASVQSVHNPKIAGIAVEVDKQPQGAGRQIVDYSSCLNGE